MKYLVVALGSAGDLHPPLALARGLARRGHEVEVMANAPYETAVRAEGLAFRAACSQRDHERTAAHPDLWHPLRGFGVLWRHLAVPAIEPVRQHVLRRVADGGATWRVLASPLAVGARLARMEQPFALASLYTAPANLRSTADPLYLGAWRVPAWMPRPARRALWWGLDRWKLEPLARPVLARACAASGTTLPRESVFGRWIHSPEGGLTLFPAWFCPPDPDWPSGLQMGDFPLFQAGRDTALPAGLQAFLDAGPKPVVVFPGSIGGEHGRALLADTFTACRALGLRVVALGPLALEASRDGRVDDPEFVHRCVHAPLGLLLAGAAVFVHHGGIGSCAQALRHRVPQVIRPRAYDQFDNAARVEADGAGRMLLAGPDYRRRLLGALDELSGGGAGAIPPRFPPAAPGATMEEAAAARVLAALDGWEAGLPTSLRPA